MATKSKFKSPSARRSSPRFCSVGVPQPKSTPHTFSKSGAGSTFSPWTDGIPRTPLFLRAITPGVGTVKSVSLSDWWLTKKANKKVLGVAGYESKGGSQVRVFSSAPISKRHDSTTLETLDGITVCISGFFNRSRTLQNGFSLEFCNRFLLGFPYNWEEEESVEVKMHFTTPFDGIPVSRYQDLLLTSSTCLRNEILDDAVSSLRDLLCPCSDKLDEKLKKPGMVESVVPRAVGVKTRGMLRRGEDSESSSILKSVHTTSKKKSNSIYQEE